MPVVPTAPEFDIGVLSPTDLNTKFGDLLRFLARRPVARLRQTSVQTVITSTATPITFTAEDLDDDIDGTGGHDNSTNPSRYTARYPGRYLLNGNVAWAANGTGRRAGWWRVNGSDVLGSAAAVPAAAANGTDVVVPGTIVYLNIDDYAELIGYHERGANLDTLAVSMEASSMSVVWLGN